MDSHRCYVNHSFEGQDHLDSLVELGVVRVLKIQSRDSLPVSAYQCSLLGWCVLRSCLSVGPGCAVGLYQLMSEIAFADVDSVAFHTKENGVKELISVLWDGRDFILSTESGYSRRSAATDVEDVSYVCSPYLPQILLES